MSATYSGDPSLSTLDQVRFLIQDTDINSPLLQNEEIAWQLAESLANPYLAAAECCLTLALKYARQPGSRSIGGTTISYADLATRFTTLALELKRRAARKTPATPYLGGLSQSDKDANDAATDHTERQFGSEDGQWTNHQFGTGGGRGGPSAYGAT